MKYCFWGLVCLLFIHGNECVGQSIYPDNIFPDSAYAPFMHGVASFEPLPDRVIIWTRVEPESPEISSLSLEWEIAIDDKFQNIVAKGNAYCLPKNDWTSTTDVSGLSQNSIYYYRFRDQNGKYSQTGRTRTSPSGDVSGLRFAIMSCSSIYSGYFNAYRRLGERDDLNLIIHVGDYIYDFVDRDEEIRVPHPYPMEPKNITEWRERHKYYLLDPDLRYARQQHPWTVMWDNHDLDERNPMTTAYSVKAFQEYVPMRVRDTLKPTESYRKFSYGNLVDLFMTDILLYKSKESFAEGGNSMMGATQREWFLEEMKNSKARWRIIGTQNMMGGWSCSGLPPVSPKIKGKKVFDASCWDGYVEERKSIFRYLRSNNIQNNLVLSGDAHISMVMDLPVDPYDINDYDPRTGKGSVGVEILPASITRGNFDEMGVPGFIVPFAAASSNVMNPHHFYTEITRHGYGLIIINNEKIKAQLWRSPVLYSAKQEYREKTFTVRYNQNHWKRPVIRIRPVNDFAKMMVRIFGVSEPY